MDQRQDSQDEQDYRKYIKTVFISVLVNPVNPDILLDMISGFTELQDELVHSVNHAIAV